MVKALDEGQLVLLVEPFALKILRREVGLEEPELASLPATAFAFTLWPPIIPSTTEPLA